MLPCQSIHHLAPPRRARLTLLLCAMLSKEIKLKGDLINPRTVDTWGCYWLLQSLCLELLVVSGALILRKNKISS
jgi:hypothetical protein